MDTVEDCVECLRLAQTYESETMSWFRLEGHLRIAEYGHDEDAAGKIAVELDTVTKRRADLRASLEVHKAERHVNHSLKVQTVTSR